MGCARYQRMLVVAAVGLGPLVGGPWTHAMAPAPSSPPSVERSSSQPLNQILADGQAPQRLIMITSERGYLLTTQGRLWWTNDGGQRWRRVSAVPTALNLIVSGGQIWAQTANRLWTRHLAVADWTSRPMPTQDFNPAQIDLINRRDGWLVTSLGMAAGAESVQIWATQNDGAHWTRVTAQGMPYQGTKVFAFVSVKDGWMFGADDLRSGVVQFYETHSAGASWSPVPVMLPASFRRALVAFDAWHQYGATDGIQVTASGGARPEDVRVTIDHQTGAAPWRSGAILAVASANEPPVVEWTGATAWVVNGAQLWRGNDWGRHWQLVHPWANPMATKPIEALTWVIRRPSIGYALVGGRLLRIHGGAT